MKKILSLILSIVIMISSFSCLSVVAGAEGENLEIPEGYTPIYTVEDLDNIRNNLDGNYILMNDIDLTEATALGGEYDFIGNGWNPIGSGDEYGNEAFTGVFDGNGYSIRCIRIEAINIPSVVSKSSYFGLFAKNSGTITDLHMESGKISGGFSSHKNFGGAIAGENTGVVINCSNDCAISLQGSSSSYDYYAYAGGIVGHNNGGTVECCYNTGTIKNYNNDAGHELGGIVGLNYGAGSIVKDCYNAGNVISKRYASGIVGYNSESSNGVMTCYNVGVVTGSKSSYPISAGSAVNNCYYHENSTNTSQTGAIALSEEQMKTKSSFSGFDFTDKWVFWGGSYPYPELVNNLQYPIVMDEIQMSSLPTKCKVDRYDELDLTDCKINCLYNGEIVDTIDVTQDMVSGYDTSKEGKQVVLVSFEGKKTSFEIEVGYYGYIPIYTVEDLDNIRNNLDGNYILMNDIDLTEATALGGRYDFNGNGWNPIGSNDVYDAIEFTGVFEGNGYSIIGMRIDVTVLPPEKTSNTVYLGLFSYSTGIIENLVVTGDINYDNRVNRYKVYIGGIAAKATRIESCGNEVNIASYSLLSACIGGVAGSIDTSIANCYNKGNIKAIMKTREDTGLSSYIGGVYGGAGSTVANECANEGDIETENYSGYSDYYKYSMLYVSGIGYNKATNCYNTGDLNSSSKSDDYGTIVEFYPISKSSENSYTIGGITFENYYRQAKINFSSNNCYYLKGCYEFSSGTPIENTEFSKEYSFKYFDFEKIWIIDENAEYKYPQLRQISCNINKHIYEWEYEVEPTCTETGVGTRFCVCCGETTYFETTPKLPHCTDDWVVSQMPTSTTCGIKTKKCSVCKNIVETELTPLLPDDYIPIFNLTDLYLIKENMSGKYLLMNDLDMSEEILPGGAFSFMDKGWEPLGSGNILGDNKFSGVFDGNGFTISGVKTTVFKPDGYTGTINIGLFSNNEGEIRNLTIKDSTIISNIIMPEKNILNVGIVCAKNSGVIENCCVENCYITVSDGFQKVFAGGITGINTGEIKLSECTGEINVTAHDKTSDGTVTSAAYVGGISGESSGEVSKCFNKAYVYAYAQGTYGLNSVGNSWSNPGVVYVGGIVGCGGDIFNCYNTGVIDGTVSAGISHTADSISLCYNIGQATKSITNSAEVLNCYFLSNSGGAIEGAVSYTEYQMKQEVLYKGFDFSDIWYINPDSEYPYPQIRKTDAENCVHEYSDWYVDKEPNCTEIGVKHKICVLCGGLMVEDIESLGHEFDYGNWHIDKEATCSESGIKYHKCIRCNEKVDLTVIPQMGHTYEIWNTDTEPTCTSEGSQSTECTTCGYILIKEIEPTDHSYSNWETSEKSTCEEPGKRTRICDVCGFTDVETIPAYSHSYSTIWSIDIPATCTENGSKSHHCLNCDSKIDETEISATGHSFCSWRVEAVASCTQPGTRVRMCEVCGTEEREALSSTGHTFSTVWTIDVSATCTENGSKSHHCINCDAKEDITEIVATGHTYGNWQVTKEATCMEKGEKSSACEICGDTKIADVDATGHTYSSTWTIDSPATCTEVGSKSHHCLNCGEKKDITEIPATGHSITNWEIVEDSTCTKEGVKKGTCDKCDYFEEATIPAHEHIYSTVWTIDKMPTCVEVGLKSYHCTSCDIRTNETEIPTTGHTYGSWRVAEEATCNKEGLLERVCTGCDEKETKTTEKTEHNFSTTWTIETPATCTEDGVKYRKCINCEEKTDVSRITATGHLYGAWIFDSDASCEDDGLRHKTCEYCGDEQKQTVMALGHHYSSMWTIDKDPTCLTKGEKSHHCLRCNDKTDIEEIPFGGHIFDAWKITEEPTIDSEGMREHKCYNCDETEALPIAKLKRYTATFVADGDVVATVDFPEDATEIEMPDVPFKDKYVGEWENFDVRNKNFIVNAIYTPVYSDSLDGITATNKTEYYPSTGEVEINLHAEAIEKTIVTTTKTAIPLDIVFVLDQSGSMEDGNKTEELKSAVTAFSNTILEDAKTNNVEHRIAIVGFASGSNNNLNYENTELLTAETVKYNAVTDDDYKNALVVVNDGDELNSIITKAIKNIDAKGATKADLGLEMASNIFANNPVTDNRQRVVVFLTDGVPTSYSSFEFSVANAAILNAYQIKNTYDATIYSVGIFDRETSGNRNVNNFMNYVSSNYNEEKVLSRNKRETTPVAAGYYLDVSDVSKLSEIFTTIVEEAIIHTGEFDDVTLKYTLSKDFCLTSIQKEKLRKDAIELLEVSNNQISITENADGTTTVIITDIEPWSSGGKYVVDFTFRATANENTMKSGSYRAGTYDSGIMLNNSTEYEAVFAPELFDVIGTNSMAIFSINGEPYAIDRVSSTKMILAPDVDFGEDHEFSGWNVPENLTLKNECRIFEASLDRNEYIISWNINGQVTEQKYEVGSSITPPTVKGDEIEGMIFVGWDKEIPEAMPSENLTFTAVYNSHYHNYTITKEFETCDKGGTLTYTCVCGDSYDEQIEPTEHKYEAITGATENNTQHNVGFRCSVCGSQDDKKLELERTDTTQTSNSSHSTATYEFDYVDKNGENCQPDGEVQISVQLDEVFNGDIPENATATVYRVNDDGSRTKLESTQDGMNMTFETDHFSTYEFEFTTEVQKYMFAQVGSVIDTKNKIIFSENYVAMDCSKLVSYLAPATITSESNPYGFFGTGSSITFENNGVVEEYKVIIKGDLNGDSVCDALDCMLAELIRTGNCEATQEQIYAVNNDIAEEVDIYDFQNIINWALAR